MSATPHKEIDRPDTLSLKECIPREDSFINNKNSVQYIIIDTFYTVKLKVGGIDTVLSYQFNCSVPKGLVPAFYSYSNDMICLIRGYGQHFREFIISYVKGQRVIIKNYETALISDLNNSVVVYHDEKDLRKIVVENIKNGNQTTFNIPSKYIAEVPESSIAKGKLRLAFSDGNVISFSLSKNGVK